MDKKLLIFDFDGTIVDSKKVYYHAIESYLAELGLSKKESDEAIDVGLSINATLAKLGFGFVTRFFTKRKIMKKVLSHVNEIKKVKDAEHIKRLKAKKILVSNSLKEFILPVLKHLRIKDEFQEIYGADDFPDKADFIKDYIKKRGFSKEEIYYIGDRVADVKLARKIGIKSVII